MSYRTPAQRTEAWMQDLHDLMANKKIKLIVEGEMGEVDASLLVWDASQHRYDGCADVIAAETFDEAMQELVQKALADTR